MNVLSERSAFKLLGVANYTARNARKKGILIPSEERQLGTINYIAYDELYLRAVKAVLPKRKDRGGRSRKVFTDEVVAKIAKINKKWFG